MDDLDDVLNDLLAEDPVPKKKPAPTAARARRGGKPGPTVHDDDFYKSLAADAGDSVSDVSEADPAQMAQGMDDLDDMDAALFGPKKAAPKTPPSGGATGTKTRPSAPPSPIKSPAAAPVKKSTLDFDDYDDPLADLLSDDEVKKPKRSEVNKAKPKEDFKTEPYKPSAKEPEEDNSSESRRLEINRPPTRSGNKKPPARKEDNMFDDEDVLGGMGFDESPRAKVAPRARSADDDATKGRSIMDDLLGTSSSVSKHLEAPGSSGGKREFVLDKKYQKQEAKPKEFSEEDFNFGGYMPSAVTTPGSRPSSKRSVRFEGDDGDAPVSRGASGGGRRGGGAAGFLEDMISKDDRDWLDIASNAPTTEKERPKSEGSLRSSVKEAERPNTSQSAASEPVDWLGLSRLGSPKLTSKDDDKEDEQVRPRSGGRGGIPKELPDEPDDWLGTSSSPSKSKPESRAAPTADKSQPDDWLGASPASGKDADWLGASSASGKGTDWLGMKDSPRSKDSDPDDWLGFSKGKDTGKSDDWLGGASTTDKSTVKDSAASGDYLGLTGEIDDPFKTPSKARADERALDLFSPPPTKDTKWRYLEQVQVNGAKDQAAYGQPEAEYTRKKFASFPWDSDSAGGRRRGRARTPQKGTRPQSPRGSSPKRPASPRGPSPADSPRDLMATLDALKKMDQQKKPGPVKATAISTSTPSVPTTQPDTPLPAPAPGPPMTLPGMGLTTTSSLDMQAGMMPPAANSQMDEFRRQEDIFQKQQQMLMQQQQKQQMEQQRVLAEQQERRRQQMQQMAEAQQRMMQQQMEQQRQQMTMQMPMTPGMNFGSSMVSDELMSQVKRLEMEKMHLMTLIETSKQQHEEELKLLDDSHKKRVEMMEESSSRREQRLREENEFLISQGHKKVELVEQEKSDLLESHLKRQEAWDRDHRSEIERIREQHRTDMDNVRKEHEESLQRLRRAKQMEVEAVANQHSTTENLRGVLDQISENARGLNDLQTQVQLKHNLSLDEREMAARSRDDQLKALHERLERQHHDNEQERARLQGLLTKLEAQLTEQVRSNEEEKWRVRQEEGRLQAAQDSLEKEKSMVMTQLKRDRESVQKSKDQLLDEQKTVLAQLYEERRQLAQERAAFEMDTKLNTEKAQRENLKIVKTGAELEGSVRIINDEKSRLAEQLDNLRTDRDQLAKERAELEQQRQSLAVEKEKLETIALQVRQRSKDIEDMCLMAAQAREAGENSLGEARRLEGEQVQRLSAIQAQLQTLHTKERQIAQERLSLAKERQSIESNAKSLMCVSCRTPVRETAGSGMQLTPSMQDTSMMGRKMTPAAANLLSALDPDLKAKITALDSVSAEIEMDRSIRLWRIAAKKDEEFLTEESMFLQAIRHTPYSDTAS